MRGIRIHDPQCSPNALVHGVQPSHDEPMGQHNDGTCWHSQPWYQRSCCLVDRSIIPTRAAGEVCRLQGPNRPERHR